MRHRSSGTAWRSATLRAARRRAGANAPRAPQFLTIEPLPPLVCPDDDREFVEGPQRHAHQPAPESTPA